MDRRHRMLELCLVAALALLLCCAGAVRAQTTAFTYQGKLTDGGNPANGNYDLQFQLFRLAANGIPELLATLVRSPVAVSAGIFAVTLDFGEAAFDVTDHLLGVGVRPAGSAAAYEVLEPSQPVTAVPYAIQSRNAQLAQTAQVAFNAQTAQLATTAQVALDAQSLGGLPPGRFVQTDPGGNVGIGTAAPAHALEVNGVTSLGPPGGVYAFLVDGPAPGPYPTLGFNSWGTPYQSGVAGSGGLLQFQDGTGTLTYYTAPGAAAGEQHVYTPRLTVLQNGNVGLGTIAPLGALEVRTAGAYPAVSGLNTSVSGIGVEGVGKIGVYGAIYSPPFARAGVVDAAVNMDGIGVSGVGHFGVYGAVQVAGTARAGVFDGGVDVYGTLTKSAGSFKIDHPLDPANKYLYHSFVESPDMKNIYDGNVTTDGGGRAVVMLPDWFEALNKDFRYQLTVIGTFAQAIIAEKIRENRFTIETSLPNVEVSWQVTGIRQDAYANKYRVPVEEPKPIEEQGSYLHPDTLGQPAAQGTGWRLRQGLKKGPGSN